MKKYWKAAPGLEMFFEVSNYGEVRSKSRKVWLKGNGGTYYLRTIPACLRRPPKEGYFRIPFRGRMYYAHRLIALAWVPNPEKKPEVNHKDGNKQNNKPKNLEWVTRQENISHSVSTGLKPLGANCWNARLTTQEVADIREKRAEGVRCVSLARAYKVSHATISRISRGISRRSS